MDNRYEEVTARLKEKIGALISKYEAAMARNAALRQERDALALAVEQYKNQKSQDNQKIQQLQLTQAFKASSVDVKEAKQRINKIVKEIDKCMALLNS